ncbi:hypothetical protein EXW72_00005 [Pseudomonas sp. BCA14]|nr:hypothetical protein EXW70_03685 [Pseudomonas sp. JMN1]TFF15679.1 hypothetical protein EXW71_05355 [Pseudomonas sp. BCA17]TFF30456.1 hypothetical protein EXW72_00005 [Pseudomonas sp. BCA14]TFF33039.1 hypothetical protein EXW73_04605 [Pseudomonas sp. BCA13]
MSALSFNCLESHSQEKCQSARRSIGTVARELAPAGSRSGPSFGLEKIGPAAQSNGSKLPRHKLLVVRSVV